VYCPAQLPQGYRYFLVRVRGRGTGAVGSLAGCSEGLDNVPLPERLYELILTCLLFVLVAIVGLGIHSLSTVDVFAKKYYLVT
jgi:hypothetical protein